MHLGDNAGMHAAAQMCQAATRKSWEAFDLLDLCRPQRRDPALGQISFIAESAGIAKIPRCLQLRNAANAFAVMEFLHRRRPDTCVLFWSFLACSRGIDIQANAGMNRYNTPIRDLNLLAFQVDDLPNFPKASRLNSAFVRDVRGDLQFRAIDIAQDRRIQPRRRRSYLDVHCPGQEKCRQGQRPSQP